MTGSESRACRAAMSSTYVRAIQWRAAYHG